MAVSVKLSSGLAQDVPADSGEAARFKCNKVRSNSYTSGADCSNPVFFGSAMAAVLIGVTMDIDSIIG